MWDSIAEQAPVYESQASAGPRLGFLGALEAAYDDQVKNSSVNGLAYSFQKADEQQAAEAKKNGVEYVPFGRRKKSVQNNMDANGQYTTPEDETEGMQSYYKMARTIVDNEDNDVLPDFAAHDAEIMKHNMDNPYKLKTMTELYDGVKQESQKAAKQAELPWNGVGGVVGGIIGGAVGGLNPYTDPVNVATLPLGGGGRTVLGRIAMQAVGQGAAETLNQLTGVQENRRLLGLDHGVSNAAFSIAGAAGGGALIQGGGELLGAGLRRVKTGRWFADSAKDVAPPAPAPAPLDAPARVAPVSEDIALRSPLTDSRFGEPRAQADLSVVHNQLSDWGGPRPYEIAPKTDTRIPGAEPRTDGFKFDAGPETVDTTARRLDPEVFDAYDKYNKIKSDARAEIDSLGADRNSKANESVQNLNDQIDELRQKTDGATRRLGKKYEARIADLTKQRDQFLAIETKGDTPEMTAARQRLMEADYALRDMKPALNRAYGNAQNKFTAYEGERARIDKMLRDGASGIDNIPVDSKLPKEPPEDLIAPKPDPIPERQAMSATMKPGESISEAIGRFNEQVKQAVDDTIDTFGAFAKKATKEVAADAAEGAERETHIELTIHGKQVRLALDGDKISIPTEDGGVQKMTPRELLKEVDNDNSALQAISTCSLSATS